VDDAAQVRVRERIRGLAEQPPHLVDRAPRLVLEQLRDVAAADERHDEVGDPVALPHVVDRHDVGVCELGGRLGLTREAGAEGGIVRELRGEDLDRDEPLEPEIARPIDHGHAAAADLVLDLVLVAEGVGDAVAEGIGHGGDTRETATFVSGADAGAGRGCANAGRCGRRSSGNADTRI
jgi:hypothetical protein